MTSPCSSNEKRNFQCVILASVDFIKLPLTDILASHIKPVDLCNKIKSCSTLNLSQKQLQTCSITPPDYNSFDITLLYTLIRNLCSLPCPAQGWGKEPKATDIQLSDDIERLRLFRNNYYAHATSSEISENEFKDIWSNLKLVISRIQSNYNKDYEEELKNIEQSKFSKCQLDICMKFLDTLQQNHADGEDRPDIYIKGENEILCGGTARFEADVKNVEVSSWSVTWRKCRRDVIKCIDTSMEKYNGSTKRKLVINSLSKEDEGEYTAVLSLESNGPDYKSKNTIRLHVIGDVPKVRISVDSPVCFGSETTIKSEVSSTLRPDKYEWQKSKDGNFLCNENTVIFTCPSLVIPKTTFADKLYYRLLVWNRIGEGVSNTIFLNVTGSPPNITTSFETNIKDRSVKLIGNVFVYDDSPGILDTFWTKKQIKTEENSGKLLEGNIDSPTLIINNVSPADAGEYQLTAKNAVGTSTSDVIVIDIPSVFVENIENESNGGLRFSVTIKSLPVPCNVQWIAKSKDDDNFTPIDIYSEDYTGSTVSFPHPVLVVKQRGQLEEKSFHIEVKNFIGKTVKEISGISLHKKTSFITFSNDLITKFPQTKVHHLKYLLRASEKVRDVESLKEAKSVLECFAILQEENLFTKRNVIFLQLLLKLTECDELNEMCINYALNQNALCYFDNSSAPLVIGFKNVKFHVKGDVDNYSKKEIDDILEAVAEMVDCEKRDILVNGVLPSMSFIIVLFFNEAYVRRLTFRIKQDCNKLRRLNIDYFIVGEYLFFLESPKGTVEKNIYKEPCRDKGIEFAKLCNYLAQMFPQEKLLNLKQVILSASGKLENTMFCMTANSAMECFSILLNEKRFSKNDVTFLAFLFKETACFELYTKCINYALLQESSSIEDICQHVQVRKGLEYSGLLKDLLAQRSDILKDGITTTTIEKASVQTVKHLLEFVEKDLTSANVLNVGKLKTEALVDSIKIETAVKNDPDKVVIPKRNVERQRDHPGTSFAGNEFKNVEFYLRGNLADVREEQIKEMQETVAAVVEDEALIKQQKQYSLTIFCIVCTIKEEYLKKLLAIEQRNREKLRRLNVEYFIAGFVTVYIDHSTGYQRWTPSSKIQENILDVDNNTEGSTASLTNKPFAEDTSNLKHPTYTYIHTKCLTISTDYIYHISCMTSDSLWISGFDGLLEINKAGIIIKKLETDFTFGGNHTVTKNGEVLFIRAFDVYLLTTSGEIEKICLRPLLPFCLHSSKINDDILVGSTNIVTRHSKQGKLLQEIKLNEKGNLLYGNVHYVTENKHGDIIVSDHVKKAVVSVNKSGRHQFDYKGNASQVGFIPCGVCSDVNGEILVCNSSPDDLSIHLLDQSGQYLMHLLTKEQYGFLKPKALCLDEMQNIYVGGTNKILVVTYLTATEVKERENKLMLSKV